MSTSTPLEISRDGLWRNNPALVQLLGLCPLLAVSGNVVNALGLGLATTFVLIGSNGAVSLLRQLVPESVRLPAYVMIIASFTTCATLLMQAFAFELYLIVALYVQIIVTNCAILGRADGFASRNPVGASLLDGAMMGLGFTLVLCVLGALREVLAQGTLLAQMDLLFGPVATDWRIVVLPDYRGFLLAALPPGAFIAMGFLIALKHSIDRGIDALSRREAGTEVGSRRVRTTGEIG